MPDATAVTPTEWAAWRAFLDMRARLDLTIERQLQHDAEISASDFGVLVTLFEAPKKQLRAGELGETLGWEKSRVSHQVSRMEKRGLVERRLCNEDARGTWVGMTPDGSRAVLGAMRDHAATLRRHFFDVLTPEELEVFRVGSARVLEKLKPVPCDD
jgi:DNA-binding MarR family transcriptional regulator